MVGHLRGLLFQLTWREASYQSPEFSFEVFMWPSMKEEKPWCVPSVRPAVQHLLTFLVPLARRPLYLWVRLFTGYCDTDHVHSFLLM